MNKQKENIMKKTNAHSKQTMVVLITAFIMMMAVFTACNAENPQPAKTQSTEVAAPVTTETPAIDGAALLETRCSGCHSADRARKAKKTREGWDKTVSSMIRKGAALTDAEKTVLVDYLSENYGQ